MTYYVFMGKLSPALLYTPCANARFVIGHSVLASPLRDNISAEG